MPADDNDRETVAAVGSGLYYSTLFIPPEERGAVTTLHAFGLEVSDVIRKCSDPGVARVKLQWWREETQRAIEGHARHPLGQALSPIIKRYRLPIEDLFRIIDCTEATLNATEYSHFTDLVLHCEGTTGLLWQMSTTITGYQDSSTLEYAKQLGCAVQLATILQDVRADATGGRIFIPKDDMERLPITVEDLVSAKSTDRLKQLFRLQIDRTREQFGQAIDKLPESDRWQQLHGLIMSEIVLATLNEVERDGYRVLEQHIVLTPLRKLLIAWLAMRREKRRRQKTRTS